MENQPDIIFLSHESNESKRARIQRERQQRRQHNSLLHLVNRLEILVGKEQKELGQKTRDLRQAMSRIEEFESKRSECSICKESLDSIKDQKGLFVHDCGHINCQPCSLRVMLCPICRAIIRQRKPVFI
jgi:hypothetical protein